MSAAAVPDDLNGPPDARRRLAGTPAAPEVLVLLANDPDAGVRAAVAANPDAPAHADRLLALDAEVGIRAAVARKLGGRAPELLPAEGPDHLPRRLRLAREALLLLARDVVAAVRAAVADALADLPDAPRELVLELARDAALEVCEPLIRLSRALREEDLVALVREPPGPQTRVAVARRLQLEEGAAVALVECGDAEALRTVLRNTTARLPGPALARLAARAGAIPWLPEALLARPGLPAVAIRSLLPMLSREALGRLAARPELPAAIQAALRERAAVGAVMWGDVAVTEASRN